MAKFCKIVFFLLFSSFSLTAQNTDIKFVHLSVNGGLSNNIVEAVIQDSRGFMWFGTEDGLNKYDGYKFTVYRHNPEDSQSISGNFIRSLCESHYGGKHVLWVGTDQNGLNKMDLETEQFMHFRYDPDELQSLSNDKIISIYEDSLGELWIGTNAGINKFDRETEKFIRYQHDPNDPNSLSNNIWCTIYETITNGTSLLWIGTANGLNKFDRKTEKFTCFKHDPHNLNSLSHDLINDLFAGSSGLLWITTNQGGLNKLNIETGQFTRFQYDPNNSHSLSHNMVVSVIQDNYKGKHVLWITTYNGLNRFDLETERFTHYKNNPDNPQSICSNNLIRLYKDKSGIIWIGTHGGGISKFDPGKQNFAHLKHITRDENSLSNNFVFSIIESKYYGPDVFWIGTTNGGLNKFDKNTRLFTHYRHDPDVPNGLCSDIIITLLESQYKGRNELWIGTLDGLDKLDLRTNKFTHYRHDPNNPNSISNNIIRSICEDKTGTLWVGTRNGGINRFDRDLGRFDPKKYNIGEALSIIEDHNGIIWAGTSRGLFQYNSSTNKLSHYKSDPQDPHSLSNRQVLSIYEDKSSRLWIGTKDGLNLYNRETNKFTRFKIKDGLPNNVINGILADNQGNLWLSTNHGLSKYNPLDTTFKNYDRLDGLQSNQFNQGAYCLSQKGEMLFGGVNGLSIFHPDSIRDNPNIPDVYLTDFKLFNKTVRIKPGYTTEHKSKYFLPKHITNLSEITLSHKESVFSFEFAGLDYHSPQKNRYAYLMQDIDPDWVYTDASRRFATYTNLDPGEYLFQVKGSNNDGIWNEEGTSVKIIITPPWWRTDLAYAFYLLLLGTIVITTWRLQLKRIQLNQRLKMEHFKAEKLREVDHMKSRFFTNISHEFRTPLTLIKGPLEQLLKTEFQGNLHELYKMMLNNSKRLLVLINQILDLSKLESGLMKLQAEQTDVLKLLKGLVLSFCSLADRKKIILKFESAEKSLICYIDHDKIEKIVTNLLSNAFKFTPEQGSIEVSLKLSNAKAPMPNEIQNPIVKIIPNSKLPVPRSCFIEISISNSGPGIPQNLLDKIFDRFYQTDATYKKEDEGSGIGLALTKELVEVCHGKISVSSTPNKNTTFLVRLPVSKEYFKEDEIIEEMESADRRQETGKKETKSIISENDAGNRISDTLIQSESLVRSADSSLQPPVVLIVEDNPDVTRYICSFLDHDYRIITAENGREGWKKALSKYPDLIISDVIMPEMDGFKLCKKIKSDQRTSHFPVILLTARADLDSKIEGLEFGADDYISKPFEADELKVRVKNLIDQRQILRQKFSRLIEIKPEDVTTSSMDEQFLVRLLEVFEQHISEANYSTESFARDVGMSRPHLNRKLKALTDLSTHRFILNMRLKRAAHLLKKRTGTVSEIAYTVGFNSPSKFARAFKIQYGHSPSKFSKKEDS